MAVPLGKTRALILPQDPPSFFSARVGQIRGWSLRQCYVCCVIEPFSIQHCWKAAAGAVKVFFESGRTRGLRKRTKMILVKSNLYATEVILPRAKSDVENTFFIFYFYCFASSITAYKQHEFIEKYGNIMKYHEISNIAG